MHVRDFSGAQIFRHIEIFGAGAADQELGAVRFKPPQIVDDLGSPRSKFDPRVVENNLVGPGFLLAEGMNERPREDTPQFIVSFSHLLAGKDQNDRSVLAEALADEISLSFMGISLLKLQKVVYLRLIKAEMASSASSTSASLLKNPKLKRIVPAGKEPIVLWAEGEQ